MSDEEALVSVDQVDSHRRAATSLERRLACREVLEAKLIEAGVESTKVLERQAAILAFILQSTNGKKYSENDCDCNTVPAA